MENLRELQAQALNLERAGRHAAAVELYASILAQPAADRDGGTWARVAKLQLALGDEQRAAESYATAAERYEAAGLGNLALAQWQRALRSDASRAEPLLRFGRLAASRGYARDARHGFVEYADRAAEANDVQGAAGALREYLAHFPSDQAVRGRISELTGVEEPTPAHPARPEAGPSSPPQPLPGLTPTALDTADAAEEVEPRVHAPAPPPPETEGQDAPGIAPLEGFEPTHTGEAYSAPPRGPTPLREADAHWSGAQSADEALDEEEEHAEPLPLLGFDAEHVPDEGEAPGAPGDESGAAAGETADLPLMNAASESAPRPMQSPDGALQRARERVRAEPGAVSARRELHALLRARSDPALEGEISAAEQYFADAGRAGEALEFAEELARLRPDDTGIQQRRVERALRAGNRPALIAAYLALAGRLEAELQTERAQDALRRVLELDPANEEARAALTSTTAAARPPRDYVDLGELILSGAPEEVTRFQVAIGDPTGDEESDFAEILDLFRKKVSESLDPKDAASHYDLGLAFKEMGLLDDAIVHLQSGLRGGANPLATLEVLGECFVMKGQVSLASRVFERATRLEGVGDSDLVGVLYGLARTQEALGQMEDARGTFERVVAVDLSFRDAAERLQHLQSR